MSRRSGGGNAADATDVERPTWRFGVALLAALLALGAGCAPYVCDQSSCVGCCNGSTCVAGRSPGACGRLGERCQVCAACSFEGVCMAGSLAADGGR